MPSSQAPVRFTGHKALAHRLLLSTLTGRPVHISEIRPSSPSSPGLAPHEISFLRLLEAVTNGSQIEISYTGTIVVYKPGLIIGSAARNAPSGGVLRHEIPATCTRGISYFLIPLCLLAPFAKDGLNVLLAGAGVITSSTPTGDVSVDTVRQAILPHYASFGIDRNIELRILQRSNPGARGKGGAGEVQLLFGHQVRIPKTVHLLNPGRVKRIRGVAYSTGVPGSNNARMIEAARGVLNPLVSDTYVFSDVSSAALVATPDKNNLNVKRKVGIGFGLSLVAESSTGSLYSADVASAPEGGQPADNIGRLCAYQLLESIAKGGRVSIEAAPTVLTLMAMGSDDVGRLQLSRDVIGHADIIQLARDLAVFGAAGWGIRGSRAEREGDQLVVSIIGRGIGNTGRKVG